MNKKSKPMPYKLNDLFLACMCKRFLEIPGTKILILTGNELNTRIKRRIVDSDLPIICKFLQGSPRVVAANLSYNRISDNGMDTLVTFLEENSSLIELNLMNNNIKETGIMTLTRLKNMMGLKSLRLNGNKIGPHGLNQLANMLFLNTNLVCLDIGECDLNIETVVYFMYVLRNNNTLQALTLNRVLGPPGHVLQTDHVAQVIQHSLTLNQSLTELHLQKIGFSDHDVEILVEGLKQNTTILLLDLGCNNIGDFGIECLAEYIGGKPSLLALIMNNNIIGDTGARALSFKFPYSKIKFLDISKNKIKEDGLLDILNCLKKEHPVLGLYIRGNQISGPVCKVLFRMLLSGVLNSSTLDVYVYQEHDLSYSSSEAEDHIKPHYYCLCAQDKIYCRHCTVMNIRNK